MIYFLNNTEKEFGDLTIVDFLLSKKTCYCGVRSIYKRIKEIIECLKTLNQLDSVIKSGNTKELIKINSLIGISRTLRNEIFKEYYDVNVFQTEQQVTSKFANELKKFHNAIEDLEINKCELCHQLNTNSEMAAVLNEQLVKHSIFKIIYILGYLVKSIRSKKY